MKNKTLMIFFIFAVLLLSIGVYASNHPDKDIDANVKNKTKDKLDLKGFNNIRHSELLCDFKNCEFSMWQKLGNETYNLGKHKIPARNCTSFNNEGLCEFYYNFTNLELENLMELKMASWLDNFVEVLEKRDNINNSKVEKVSKGKVKVKKKN